MPKQIIPCICMTCGVRNDIDNPEETGYCKNGHDNWLEYRDVMEDGNEWVRITARKFNLSTAELIKSFLDVNVTQL